MLPRFNVGDKVRRIGLGAIPFSGTVIEVIEPSGLSALLNNLVGMHSSMTEEEYRKAYDKAVQIVRNMLARDKEFDNQFTYFVQPESSPGPATYDEAVMIIPSITEEQYYMLMYGRKFLVTDSELIEIEEITNEHQ